MLCICFMFVRISGIQWYKFRDNPTHISLLEAGKRILVDFTKMKRETTSEYSVILTAFYPFFVKVLTSRPARIFSKRVVTLFWVLGSLPQIRAIQRTLNHDRTTSQSFFIRHCFNPPPLPRNLHHASLHDDSGIIFICVRIVNLSFKIESVQNCQIV